MRMGSLEAFVESTRGRIRHGDAKLLLIDELLAAFYERTIGDPPIELMARGAARVVDGAQRRAAGDPGARSRAAGHPAVHQRIDQRAEGRDDPRPGAGRQHRRVVHRCRARRGRGDGVVAAAVPRHGSRRFPVDTDDERLPARAGRAAGLPRQARQLDAVDQRLGRHRHRRTELLVGAGDPGPRSHDGTSICRSSRWRSAVPSPSIRRPSRRSSTQLRRSASNRAASSRRSAWPRWRSAASSRHATAAWCATRSTVSCWSATASPSRSISPTPRKSSTCGGSRGSARRCQVWR